MRKKTIFLFYFLFFLVSENYSQLYVGGDSNKYFFVQGVLVTVQGNVNLASSEGNFFLRKDGQLMQTSSGTSTNTGLGNLSVFQEGTVNNYQYNYWCSPVGEPSSVAGNSKFGISRLKLPLTTLGKSDAVITSGLDGVSANGSLTISKRWIHTYQQSSAYSGWVFKGDAIDIKAGEGFSMKGTMGTDNTIPVAGLTLNNSGSNQRYDFRGKPNSGDIKVPVANGKLTLTGNPYPSAIDLNLFLNDAANTPFSDGTALFWEHDKTVNSHYLGEYRGGYGVYNATTSVYTPAVFYTYDAAGNKGTIYSAPGHDYKRRFSPVGQGFMVRGKANGELTIKNSHRVFVKENVTSTTSQFERKSNAKYSSEFYPMIPNIAGVDYTKEKIVNPNIKLKISFCEGVATKELALVLMSGCQTGVDRGDSRPPSRYTKDINLMIDQESFIHDCRPFDMNTKYPLKCMSDQDCVFRIQKASEEAMTNSKVYLHNKKENLYYDLNGEPIPFSVKKGEDSETYEIVFTNESEVLDLDDVTLADDLVVYYNKELRSVIIENKKEHDLKKICLLDLTGRNIKCSTLETNEKSKYVIGVDYIQDQTYIVKIQDKLKNTISKKIIIY
ncbi:hypothetical protein EH230_12555 [Flavobacterium columnare]|uniref:T9SS C-terminal target domain-containing protein n=1 Tax=Flavobacterium columnare TaxID=996 RepID=A0A437U7J3_9FLAO|nr:hypothetical protein [Flavobacterium columnare]RVU89609.1 hypothetical protein EH230_12555 [Flavobacterium columnare]